MPPVPVIPKGTSDLVASQQGSRIVLTWGYPSLTTAGTTLPGLESITVYRLTEDLPPSLQGKDPRTLNPGESDLTEPAAVALFRTVPAVMPEQFRLAGVKIDTLEAAALPDYTLGATLSYSDKPPLRTEDGRAVRITYAVTTRAKGGAKSDLSNLASIVPLNVAIPPTSLRVRSEAAGVVLDWDPPELGIAGPDPDVLGYFIYRFPEGSTDIGRPVNRTVLTTPTFTDNPPYGRHAYAVTAVALEGKQPAQSDPSTPGVVAFEDLVAPPAPAGLNVLVEEKAIRLIWDPVESPDLDGYKVYRILGGERKLLTPETLKVTNFRDATLDAGLSYTYAVSSVDRRGNESTPALSSRVLVPR